jgi:hypothetical protein
MGRLVARSWRGLHGGPSRALYMELSSPLISLQLAMDELSRTHQHDEAALKSK